MRELPGITRLRFGRPEKFTPVKLRPRPPAAKRLRQLPPPPATPLDAAQVRTRQTARGFQLEIPLADDEQLFGLGLQFQGFNHRGRKRTLRVNSDPRVDLGDSHAPVPFLVSTKGYAILVDTARYVSFYCGSVTKFRDRSADQPASPSSLETTLNTLYVKKGKGAERLLLIDIPVARGADLFVFAGPALGDAVARYVLFSGGGCVPPRWGLGVWYRCKGDFNQDQVLQLAEYFRASQVPCDVMGLEPGWQTHSYSASHVWNRDKFPEPREMIGTLAARGFRTNLWTHAFTHPASPIYGALRPYAGDYEVFSQGLVPDLTMAPAREILGGHYEREHLDLGVSGYKLDECDNSDFISFPWSFPEASQFPSGLDGEQFHSLFGINYQECVDAVCRRRNLRTYCEVRNSHALAAPYPFVLYSDLYDHREFIRGVVNAGFSGLLWCPEVRHADSAEDLIRRLQTVVLSPQALINAWYIKNPPWRQWRTEPNNRDEFLPDAAQLEAACRRILELRMQLVPYLYAAFHRYHRDGVHPFRALVMDWPDDPETWKVDDAYLIGDRLLAAPVVAGQAQRDVYLPAGDWYDFWTGEKLGGGRKHPRQVPLEQTPLFVKAGSVLPLAAPGPHADTPAAFQLEVRVYGDGALPCRLYEDDGVTYAFARGAVNTVDLAWDAKARQVRLTRHGRAAAPAYTVTATHVV